jgi:hypothetical protein
MGAQEMEEVLRERLEEDRRSIRPRPEHKYLSIAEFLLAEGTIFSDTPLDEDEVDQLLPLLKEMSRFKPGLRYCYDNALHMAIKSFGTEVLVDYVEGFAMGTHLAHHAWCGFRGRAIDLTWREDIQDSRSSIPVLVKRIQWNIANNGYAGVAIPLDYMFGLHTRHNSAVPALDNWEDGFPALAYGMEAFRRSR